LGFFAVLCAFHDFLFFIIAYKVNLVKGCAFAGIRHALLPTFHCPFTYIDAFFSKSSVIFEKKQKNFQSTIRRLSQPSFVLFFIPNLLTKTINNDIIHLLNYFM